MKAIFEIQKAKRCSLLTAQNDSITGTLYAGFLLRINSQQTTATHIGTDNRTPGFPNHKCMSIT